VLRIAVVAPCSSQYIMCCIVLLSKTQSEQTAQIEPTTARWSKHRAERRSVTWDADVLGYCQLARFTGNITILKTMKCHPAARQSKLCNRTPMRNKSVIAAIIG
jgi:hypothetical protein